VNIRELWDTVVLRDVLGFTLPGAVSLFALMLVGSTLLGCEPDDLLLKGLRYLVPSGRPWCSWQSWVAVGALFALSFVAGNLQITLVGLLDKRLPGWRREITARRFLYGEHCEADKREDQTRTMAERYRQAAIDLFCKGDRDDFETALESPLIPGEGPRDDAKNDKDEQRKTRSAFRLWKLCDFYIQQRYPTMHSTYMGRYYVLAHLFSNLGISLLILGACTWLCTFHWYHEHLGHSVILPIVFAASTTLFLAHSYRPNDRAFKAGFAACCLGGMLLLAGWALVDTARAVHPAAGALVLTGFGLMHRSGFYRREFVVRLFPIFYALTQARTQPSEPAAAQPVDPDNPTLH
jgi:hypothetical protein